MSSLCRMLGPSVSSYLISAPAWARIEALTARLPRLFCWGIFECRLQAGADRVDVLVCTSAWEGGREAVAAALSSGEPLSSLGPARPLLEAWVEEGNLVREEIPVIWLEYDLVPGEEREPFVQFCIDRSYPRAGRSPWLSPSRVRALAEHGLGLLLGDHPCSEHLNRLERCAQLLPEGGRILHLGVMPQRGTRELRVVASVPLDRTSEWLRAIRWPGPDEGAAELIELLGERFCRVSVQLDVGETVRPTLAVEYQLMERPGPGSDWLRLFDRLVVSGVCDPDKARAALGWIGVETYDSPDQPWPVHLDRQLDIKLVLTSDGTLEAKAYLGFHPRFTLL